MKCSKYSLKNLIVMETDKTQRAKFSWKATLFGFFITFSLIIAAGLLLFEKHEEVFNLSAMGLFLSAGIWIIIKSNKIGLYAHREAGIFAGLIFGTLAGLLLILNFFF